MQEPMAVGGFPFKAFEYPMPPMGGDVPPISMWPIFYVNYAVWIAVAIAIGFLLNKLLRGKELPPERIKLVLIVSVVLAIGGLGYVSVQFD